MSGVSVIQAEVISASDLLVEAREAILAARAEENHWYGISPTRLAQITAEGLRIISALGFIFVVGNWVAGYLALEAASYCLLWSFKADVVLMSGGLLGCALGLYIQDLYKYDFENPKERDRWRDRAALQLESLQLRETQYVAAAIGELPKEMRILEVIIEKIGIEGVFYYGAITPRVLQEIFQKEAESMTIFEIIDYCEYLQSKQDEATALYGSDILSFTLPTPGDFSNKWSLKSESGLILQSIARVAAEMDIDELVSHTLISAEEANFLRSVQSESREILGNYYNGITPLQRTYDAVIKPCVDKRDLAINNAQSRYQLDPAHTSIKRATERYLAKKADVGRKEQQDPDYRAAYVRHRTLTDALGCAGQNDAFTNHIELSNRHFREAEERVRIRFAPRYASIEQEYNRVIDPYKQELLVLKRNRDETISEANRVFDLEVQSSKERYEARIASYQQAFDQACVDMNRRFLRACP